VYYIRDLLSQCSMGFVPVRILSEFRGILYW
jgi:hypothetical protein